MATTPLLLVTDVGLAAASVATPLGPFIHITGFQIGSAYGYTPQRTDTGLNGNILYSGVPIAYQNIGDNTINIVLRIPADAGPFDFGEVGIMIGDNADVLFAKAVFDTLQTKFSSLGTNLQSTFTFNCLLKLEQSTAVFKIDTEDSAPAIWEVDLWSDIYPSGLSANPDIPSILVRELDQYGNSSFIHKATDEKWTLGTNYTRYGFRTITGGSTTSVQFAKSQFPNVNPTTAANRDFVIEFADGYFRSVSSVIDAGTDWLFNLNVNPLLSLPTVGSVATLYNCTGLAFASLVDIPLMTNTIQGIGRVNGGIAVDSPGVISAHGLLHSAGDGAGVVLGTLENLNYYSPGGAAFNGLYWPSGLYTITQAAGWPVNYPAVGAISGILQVVNTFNATEAGTVTQLWYPSGSAGTTESAYFRTLTNTANATWSVWRKIRISGSSGSGDRAWYNVLGSRPAGSYILNDTDDDMFVSVAIDSSSGGQIVGACYVDGIQVQSYNYRNNRYNNSNSWGFPVGPGGQYLVTGGGDNFLYTVWAEFKAL